MTRDDIIRMARSAGCHDNGEEFRFVEPRYLERFADLVAAAEREECAQLCETKHFSSPIREAGAKDCAAAIRAKGNT